MLHCGLQQLNCFDNDNECSMASRVSVLLTNGTVYVRLVKHLLGLNFLKLPFPTAFMLLVANFDHNMTNEVPTGAGLIASEIFSPEVLYSSVIHTFEYHLATIFRTLDILS